MPYRRSAISVFVWKNASGEIRKRSPRELARRSNFLPAMQLGLALARGLGDAGRLGPQECCRPLDGLAKRLAVEELALARHEPRLELTRAAALAHDEVAQEAGVVAAVVGRQARPRAPTP